MVSYDEFEKWAKDTFETKNGELLVYQDTMMFNVPMEANQAERTMSTQELYDCVEDRVEQYTEPAEIGLEDFDSRIDEVVLGYWEDQGYFDGEE